MQPRRNFRRQDTSWRPVSAYVGAVSADTEVGLGAPPVSGVLVRKVQMRVRVEHDFDANNYWTVAVYWRDASGNAFLVSEEKTVSLDFFANVVLPLYSNDSGFRLERLHELTVKFTKTGSPTALSGVQLYADLYVGI